MDRRSFLKKLGVLAGLAVAGPGIAKLPLSELKPASPRIEGEVGWWSSDYSASQTGATDNFIKVGDVITIHGESFIVTETVYSSAANEPLTLDLEMKGLNSNKKVLFSYYVAGDELVVISKRTIEAAALL